MEIIRIRLTDLEQNRGQVEGLPSNPRQWGRSELDNLVKSIRETPELLDARGLIVWPYEGKYIILGGNMRYSALREMNAVDAPCYVMPADTPTEKLREIVVKDNGSFGSWDYDMLANEWDDLPLADWGVNIPAEWSNEIVDVRLDSMDEIERKKREFEERMAAGEISEEDEEYQEFLDKFKLKKTTDDCYTPSVVYDKVAQYVAETYNLDPTSFVRPFYPGGDYQNEKYPKDCVVVDNPPFSILATILNFYKERGIRFFLFAPTLTLFSSSSSSSCTALPCTCPITYENGAVVNTSFLTNLEPSHIRLRSAPKLQAMVQEGVDEFAKSLRKSFPKYSYPPYIITSSWVGALSRLGIDFAVSVAESEQISGLDSQKPHGKGIYGNGYIVSESVKAEREKAEREKAEREKAEREKAEREKAERWELSERELQIIRRLSK